MKTIEDIRSADYAAYLRAGVCPVCKEASIKHPKRACPSCNATAAERARVRLAARRSQEVCGRCGGASGGKPLCDGCQAKRRGYRKRVQQHRSTEKVCTRCGGEIEYSRSGKTRCGSCAYEMRQIRRAYEAAKRARGECARCKNLAAIGRRLCSTCTIREAARAKGRKR